MSTSLTPADVIDTIRTHLEPWLTAHKGQLSIAGDPMHVLEILSQSPVGLRVIALYAGEAPVTEFDVVNIADAQIEVLVTFNRGLALPAGAHRTDGSSFALPLFKIVSRLSRHLINCEFPTQVTRDRLFYKGFEPVSLPDGTPLDAYKLNFTLTKNIPDETGLETP